MPTYVFKGRNRMNEVVSGERVADNPKLSGRKKVKSKDLAIFTRQFS